MRTYLGFLALLTLSAPALGQSFPFVEDFDADAANWRQNVSTEVLSHVASGGPAGVDDAYVTSSLDVMASMFGGPVVFRGLPTSSGGAFVGNWIETGVFQVSAYFRHDYSEPLLFSGRFAHPMNSPGTSTAGQSVPPDTWTELVFDIGPSTPFFGSGGYEDTFGDIGNIQFTVTPPSSSIGVVTFDLDRVTVTAVPEPAALALLGVAAVGLPLVRRRFR